MDSRSKAADRWVRAVGVTLSGVGAAILVLTFMSGVSMAQVVDPLIPPPPLSSVAVPQPIGGDIVDNAAAVKLGKALFWDVQVSGDGKVACATCHFRAGEDIRTINTINSGPDGVTPSSDDIVGSQGVVEATFTSVDPNNAHPADLCTVTGSLRRVTGRNAPSVIGAVFNRDNFWDGRANHNFNRTDPFGSTGNAGIVNGPLISALVIGNGSLGSQAVGPPDNPVEMSCTGRTFNGSSNTLAAKMLARKPLGMQKVSPTDSVLGTSADQVTGKGLTVGYQSLINDAFGPTIGANAASQFTSIFGQAVQAYESTLIPDQTPLDKFAAGNVNALTAGQKAGLSIFMGKGQCDKCHAGAELTDASVSHFNSFGAENDDGGDQGFHNIGVRPTSEDLGRAGSGPGGQSFSVSGSTFDRGAFKTPGLRNVKLNPPYFHNGGKKTLAEVVDFYSRGGDFANPEKSRRIQVLNLSATKQAQLVNFLSNGLTDCRVQKQRAPFDHPSLQIPNGSNIGAIGAEGTGLC